VPTSVFKQLVELGDGRVRGAHLLQLWKHPPLEPEAIHRLLQISDDIGTPHSSRLVSLFREWHARPSISPAPIISRSFNGSIRTISLRLAALQRSDARLTSRKYEVHFSCSGPATTRLLLPNSCWPPDTLLVVRSVKSSRRSWLVRISGCSWEQPPSYILGPRSRAGSRRPDMVGDAADRGGVGSRGPFGAGILANSAIASSVKAEVHPRTHAPQQNTVLDRPAGPPKSLSAFIVAPAPARRFAFQPARSDK